MTHFLLPFLVQQANFGLKMGRAFKREAFIAAAEAVTEKFRVRCNDGNVENHLRTIKTRYQQIRRLQRMNITVWDEKEKKIIMNDKDYVHYIVVCIHSLSEARHRFFTYEHWMTNGILVNVG